MPKAIEVTPQGPLAPTTEQVPTKQDDTILFGDHPGIEMYNIPLISHIIELYMHVEFTPSMRMHHLHT